MKTNALLLTPQPCQSPRPPSLWLRPLPPVWLLPGTLGIRSLCPTIWSSTEPSPQTTVSRKSKAWQPPVTASEDWAHTLSMSFVLWLSTILAAGRPVTLWRHAQVNRPPLRRLCTSRRACWAPAPCWSSGSSQRNPTGKSGATGSTTVRTWRLRSAHGRNTTRTTAVWRPSRVWLLTSPTASGCWASPLLVMGHLLTSCKWKPSREVSSQPLCGPVS